MPDSFRNGRAIQNIGMPALGAKNDSSLSPLFLYCSFYFFDCSGMGVGLQKVTFLSHTKIVIIPWNISASWQFSCK